jgi:hypothetical protein
MSTGRTKSKDNYYIIKGFSIKQLLDVIRQIAPRFYTKPEEKAYLAGPSLAKI